MQANRYESKSVGQWALALAGVLGLIGATLAVTWGVQGRPEALIGVFLVVMAAFVLEFGSLTVRVSDDEVQWFFGHGLIGKHVKLARVHEAEAHRSPWYWGWGIRWTPKGWLWRSYGLDAVWLTLDNGKRLGIGTQDPEGFVRAVRERLSAD